MLSWFFCSQFAWTVAITARFCTILWSNTERRFWSSTDKSLAISIESREEKITKLNPAFLQDELFGVSHGFILYLIYGCT